MKWSEFLNVLKSEIQDKQSYAMQCLEVQEGMIESFFANPVGANNGLAQEINQDSFLIFIGSLAFTIKDDKPADKPEELSAAELVEILVGKAALISQKCPAQAIVFFKKNDFFSIHYYDQSKASGDPKEQVRFLKLAAQYSREFPHAYYLHAARAAKQDRSLWPEAASCYQLAIEKSKEFECHNQIKTEYETFEPLITAPEAQDQEEKSSSPSSQHEPDSPKPEASQTAEQRLMVEVNKNLEAGSYNTVIGLLKNFGPEDADAERKFYKAAYAHVKLGNYVTAEQIYSMLIDRYAPRNHKDYYYRALCRAYLGNYDAALKDVGEAIKEDKDDERNYICRGIIYMLQGKEDKARRDFDRVKSDYWAQVYRGTKADYEALCAREDVPGQLKFYAVLKLQDERCEITPEDKARFHTFKQTLKDNLARNNPVENALLLIMAEVRAGELESAQPRYQTLLSRAQLHQIPFYLRRDFLELPLVLAKEEKLEQQKEAQKQFSAMVDAYIDHRTKPMGQAALWRALANAEQLAEYKDANDKPDALFQKIAGTLQRKTKRACILAVAHSLVEEGSSLEGRLKKHYLSLFQKQQTERPGAVYSEAPQQGRKL